LAALLLAAVPVLAADYYEVRVAEGIVARIRCKGDVATLLERGNRIDARLTEIISYEPCKKPNVHIEDENGIPVIYVGSHVLMRVFGGDAAPNNCTPGPREDVEGERHQVAAARSVGRRQAPHGRSARGPDLRGPAHRRRGQS